MMGARGPRGLQRPDTTDPRLAYLLAPIEFLFVPGAHPISLTSSYVLAGVGTAGANITSILPDGTYPGQPLFLKAVGNAGGHTWIVTGTFVGGQTTATFATDGDLLQLKWDVTLGPVGWWVPFFTQGTPVIS